MMGGRQVVKKFDDMCNHFCTVYDCECDGQTEL